MTARRLIVEMGQGADLHGEDYTKAACRAVDDALRHASLTIFRSLHLDHDAMMVGVQIGVQAPDAVDLQAVAAKIPFGEVTVQAGTGGLNVGNEDTGVTVMATAALVVNYDLPKNKWKLVDADAAPDEPAGATMNTPDENGT